MSGWFQDLLTGATEGFFGSPFVRDYAHASKTFTPNSYQNAPKFKYLFHTYFDINEEAWGWSKLPLSTTNFGLLVKEVTLPNYVMDTTILNQYNRKRIVQTKIRYNPIDITFHDDNASQATRLWEAYYRYNYRDGNIPSGIMSGNTGNPNPGDITYNTRNIYSSSAEIEQQRLSTWGYAGESNTDTGIKVPFFKNITVFGMNQHNFVAYTFINPIITQFNHDSYSYSDNGTMQNKMTIDYETVVYNYGAIDGTAPSNIVTGFGNEENYDRRLSPIAGPGSNKAILGQGGLVDSVGGVVESIGQGNYLKALYNGVKTYRNYKDVDLKETAKQELLEGAITVVSNPELTRNVTANLLKLGASASPTNVAGAPVQGAEATTVGGDRTAGQQYQARTFGAPPLPPIDRSPI